MTDFWRPLADGIEISVRATPRGGRDAIDGIMQDTADARWLSVRVSAPPDDGKANVAIAKLLAQHFDVRSRDVALVSGATARLKRLKISGDSGKLAQIATGFEEEKR
ncbi:MAG: DUF167 domain-containing protein [Alphaproteobacteria bacterium]|nr:DUF167 domain-containing protein [Alphaproteobacteria bacterium]